jgi:hypothetical protein
MFMTISFIALLLLTYYLYKPQPKMSKGYKTHNDEELPFLGGHLQGYIDCSYDRLIELFGESSHNFDDYKCDAEWEIVFDDGTSGYIYNWKNGKNYCGADGLELSEITTWNLGSNTKEFVQKIYGVIGNAKVF